MGYVGRMRFSEANNTDGHLIDAYDADGIVIGGRRYRRGLIVTPERIVDPWGPSQPTGLTVEHLDELLAFAPQIIVLGTGRTLVFPDPSLYFSLMEQRIGLEVMDTGAACRTYNILMSEGRRVAAAFMAG
ncbi:hypothetical protein Thivi_3839 [Thiocystis violascens DSM 198]|uniref:Xcc1710-like domain-containing protein n=2 Tax=Thiocystis violascens TaxID=73141 RepID=I3YFB3_THIV6|nr:hypothetical protein Thivi_3839 [Thiocystis violascens DSM 198]